MKRISIVVFLLYSLHIQAQKEQYIVFEDRPAFDTVKAAQFKLIYNHVKLDRNECGKGLDILNLYFSKYNFRAAGLDKKALIKAKDDFRKTGNDILITVTPLTDSFEQKMIRLKPREVKGLDIIKTEDLLQNAVKNLYRCFAENDIQGDDIPGIIKSTRYKLLINKRGVLYKVDVPVLTEYYLIDRASYLFPDQYHYGEINVGLKSQTRYFTGQDIYNIVKENPSGMANNYQSFARRTYLSLAIIRDSCTVYHYWTYPVYVKGLRGIGKFQFVEGVGIVNGTYGDYFDKNFIITLENSPNAYLEDFNGPFKMHLKTINGIELKAYGIRMRKADHPDGQITPTE